MPSQALLNWRTSRSDGLDALVRVHGSMTKNLQGRPRDTAELNHALIARLSSELQGYVRDLLDESTTAVLAPVQASSPTLARTYRISMELNRKMDFGNPSPQNIGTDFSRFGLKFWSEMKTTYKRGQHWENWIKWLNDARNGIAHNEVAKMDAAARVHPLTFGTFRTLRGSLGEFVGASDRVVGAYLTSITGTKPW